MKPEIPKSFSKKRSGKWLYPGEYKTSFFNEQAGLKNYISGVGDAPGTIVIYAQRQLVSIWLLGNGMVIRRD